MANLQHDEVDISLARSLTRSRSSSRASSGLITVSTTPVSTENSGPSIPSKPGTGGTTVSVSDVGSNSIVFTAFAYGLSEETRDKLKKLHGGTLEHFTSAKDGKAKTFYGVTEASATRTNPNRIKQQDISRCFKILKDVMSATGKSRPGGADNGDDWHEIPPKVGITQNRTRLAYLHLNAARLILEVQGFFKGSVVTSATWRLLSLEHTGQNAHKKTPPDIKAIESEWNDNQSTWENLWGRFDAHRALLITGPAPPRRPRGRRLSTVRSKDPKRKRAASEVGTHETGTDDSAVRARTADTGSCKRAVPGGGFSYANSKSSNSALSGHIGSDSTLGPVPSLSSDIVSTLEKATASKLGKFEDRRRVYYGVEESDARLLKGRECSKLRIIARGNILRCLLEAKSIALSLYDNVNFSSDAVWDTRLPGFNPRHSKLTMFFQYFHRNTARLILALQGYYDDPDIAAKEIYRLKRDQGGKAFDRDVEEIEDRQYDETKTPVENLWQRHRDFYKKLIDPMSRLQQAPPKNVKKTASKRKNRSVASKRSKPTSELASSSGSESDDDEVAVRRRKPLSTMDIDEATGQKAGRAFSILKSLFKGVKENRLRPSTIRKFLRDKLLPYLEEHRLGMRNHVEADADVILGLLARIRRGGLTYLAQEVTEQDVSEYAAEGDGFRENGPDGYVLDTPEWETIKEQMETAAAELLQLQSEEWLSE